MASKMILELKDKDYFKQNQIISGIKIDKNRNKIEPNLENDLINSLTNM